MSMTDPIADMLTRIRNANQMHLETVLVPASKVKKDILQVLANEGFIKGFEQVNDENNKPALKVTLKYTETKERVIKKLQRVSKPGLRVYAEVEDLPKVLNGLGIAIISTSKGVMTDRDARKANVGGEVLAYVW